MINSVGNKGVLFISNGCALQDVENHRVQPTHTCCTHTLTHNAVLTMPEVRPHPGICQQAVCLCHYDYNFWTPNWIDS